MDELKLGALPVRVGYRMLGMVAYRDITVRAIGSGLCPAATEVDLVMSDSVLCCSEQETLPELPRQMTNVQIRRLPVVDKT